MIHCLEIIETKQYIYIYIYIYMIKQQTNIREKWVTFKRIISIIATFLSCKKWLKRVWWFMYKNYFLKTT